MAGNVTKAQLCAEAAEAAGMPSRPAKRLVDAFLAALEAALKEGKRVEVRGLGSFRPVKWEARRVKPPQGPLQDAPSGKSRVVQAAFTVRFKAGAALRRMR